MSRSRAALVVTSLAALSHLGCREAPKPVDAAVTAVQSGHGGGVAAARSASIGSETSAGSECKAANHSFAASPIAGAGACTFKLPPPDQSQTQFLVQPDGGSYLSRDPTHQNGWDYTDATSQQLQIFGPTCVALAAGGAHTVCIEYQFVSDREAKRDFGVVNRDEILERLSRLPLSTWSYQDDAGRARHIGPMAQDFKSSFDVGASDQTIYPLDESGVAFAAIQALSARVDQLARENAELKQQIAALRKPRR